METVNSQVTGDIVVSQDTQYNNVFAETVLVNEGVMVRLYGLVNKEITVKKDATVYLHGKLNGQVKNEGGIVYIFAPSGEVRSL
jgi:hypothetical protein